MRRRRDIGFVVGVLVAGIVAVVVLGGGMASGASTATTTVSVTVASATSLNAAGCASGTANVTDFGTVLPATSNVTSADCSVVFGSSNDTSMLRAYQTDATGTALFGMSTGVLDTTFDGDGKATTAVPESLNYGEAVEVQPDGKIVVGGFTYFAATWYDFAVVRYNANGSIDTGFDTDGIQTTHFGGTNDQARGLALQPDGRIVLAGYAQIGNRDFGIARYNADGSLDASFDGDGKAVTSISGNQDEGRSVALQPDGRIVVAGYADVSGNVDFAVVRYNTNGSLDTSFDTDGMKTIPVGPGTDNALDLVIQPDGKIVLAGLASNGVDDDVALVRLSSTGALDASFDTDGKVTTAIGAAADRAQGVALQPDGKIVVAGSANNGANDDFALVRYNTDGSLDTTFDGDGRLVTVVGSGANLAAAVAVQLDGKIVAGGQANGPASGDFAVARYSSGGALDSSFDGDGWLTTSFSASLDAARAVTMQSDGKILAAGRSTPIGFAVARYAGGGSVSDWAGSWGAAGLFGACLHTVANASNTWALAGAGNCTTAIDANWNALPTTASKIAFAGSGVTNATANLRYGFKATASQQAGTYVAPLTFEVVAPNA